MVVSFTLFRGNLRNMVSQLFGVCPFLQRMNMDHIAFCRRIPLGTGALRRRILFTGLSSSLQEGKWIPLIQSIRNARCLACFFVWITCSKLAVWMINSLVLVMKICLLSRQDKPQGKQRVFTFALYLLTFCRFWVMKR